MAVAAARAAASSATAIHPRRPGTGSPAPPIQLASALLPVLAVSARQSQLVGLRRVRRRARACSRWATHDHHNGVELRDVVAATAKKAGGRANDLAEPLADVAASTAHACVALGRALATWEVDGAAQGDQQTNASGDVQKPLDVFADDIFHSAMFESEAVGLLASEERDEAERLPGFEDQPIAAVFDPLDGSRNIECSIPTGSIFGFFGRSDQACRDSADSEMSALAAQAAHSLLLSGYCLFSSAIVLVLAVKGGGASQWILDPSTQKWLLAEERLRIPARGQIYSLNDGRYFDWPEGLRRYIDTVRQGEGQSGKKYSARYVCCLVADFHRTVKYGGWCGNPRPHLRLLYEALPLALVAQEAEGATGDGQKRLLAAATSDPTEELVEVAAFASNGQLHAKASFFGGSREDLSELESFGDVQQGATEYNV